MGDPMHRKSLLKGILSVTTRGQQIPDAQLKEGKKIPIYMATEGYSMPENCHKPLEDLDSYYNGEVGFILLKTTNYSWICLLVANFYVVSE